MFGIFKKKLPHSDELFRRFLSPWYASEDRPQITRPDMYIIAGYNGEPLDLNVIQYLDDELLREIKQQIRSITEAAVKDYQTIIKFEELSLHVLDTVDKYYTRERISKLIEKSNPDDYSNPYLISVC